MPGLPETRAIASTARIETRLSPRIELGLGTSPPSSDTTAFQQERRADDRVREPREAVEGDLGAPPGGELGGDRAPQLAVVALEVAGEDGLGRQPTAERNAS